MPERILAIVQFKHIVVQGGKATEEGQFVLEILSFDNPYFANVLWRGKLIGVIFDHNDRLFVQSGSLETREEVSSALHAPPTLLRIYLDTQMSKIKGLGPELEEALNGRR